ncbi:MAG TPA: PAS domain S-box protein [Anaerolineae bacterium]|nr:PAS domain S-box protein [Anaerolineae bacterium]
MMHRLKVDPHSLPIQMVFSAIVLVLLTAAFASLPALWLISRQLDRQAWAQLEQGRPTTQALYTARETELISLATLMAQRPTLHELLLKKDLDALQDYLRTLQTGARSDLVVVCDQSGNVVAGAGEEISVDACALNEPTDIYSDTRMNVPRVLLLSMSPVVSDGVDIGQVIAGITLNNAFAEVMRAQTGLEHTVFIDGQLAATSFSVDLSELSRATRQIVTTAEPPEGHRTTFNLLDKPYYALRLPIRDEGLEAEVALCVEEIIATRHGLIWGLAGSILAIAVAASIFGAYLARRIGSTFASLTEAAEAFSKGDLDTPVKVEARVREASLVAQALDSARVDLRQTLRQLQQEKAWTDQLLDAIVEGIIILDDSRRITFFSPGAERITGWKREQVMKRSCDEFFRPLETKDPFSELIPRPGQRRTILVQLADGQQATLAITGAQLAPSGAGETEVVLVIRDISEEEAVHRLLGHFMANVSHEFRTPLSALAASIELLMDQASDLNPLELHELLNSLHLGILGLQTLVDNLLESASIETGHFRVSPRPTDLAEIIGEAAKIMQPLLDKRGQFLSVELPAGIPIVHADSRRVLQVMINLLSNANLYSPDETEISIDATIMDGWVQVSVADRGPGISPEHREDIFRRFPHIDSRVDEIQYGAGLGLSVVKAIIEAHQCKVGVNDHLGGGSIFWFTLPIESKR